LDARNIDLGTQDGFASFWLKDPRSLSIEGMQQVAEQANYTLTGFETRVRGAVQDGRFVVEPGAQSLDLAPDQAGQPDAQGFWRLKFDLKSGKASFAGGGPGSRPSR